MLKKVANVYKYYTKPICNYITCIRFSDGFARGEPQRGNGRKRIEFEETGCVMEVLPVSREIVQFKESWRFGAAMTRCINMFELHCTFTLRWFSTRWMDQRACNTV